MSVDHGYHSMEAHAYYKIAEIVGFGLGSISRTVIKQGGTTGSLISKQTGKCAKKTTMPKTTPS